MQGCGGNYEDRRILHTVRHKGEVVVIDRVPAEVCDVCGDVLLKPEIVTNLESMLIAAGKAPRTAPVYDYA
jgi:YgiT-type zinc finger domain-containing protein